MKTLLVSDEDLERLLTFFKDKSFLIMKSYGNDESDGASTKDFENDLLQLLDEVFDVNCSKRLQYSKIFNIVSEAEKDKNSQKWKEINGINESLPLLEKIKIGTKDGELTSNHLWKIIKFGDHLNLSVRQQVKIDEKTKEIDDKVKKVNEEFDVLNEEMRKLDESIIKQQEDLNKNSRELQTSFMGILSIFTAVVFTLFGGLNILSQLFARINNIAEPREVFGALLIGIFFALLIYIITMGLLLFSKKDLTKPLKEDVKKINIGGVVLILLFILVVCLYYKAPYPQYQKSKDEITVNNKM